MGFWDAFKSALGLGGGAGTGGADRGLYVYVQCNRCQDVVRVRINIANEVSELSDDEDDAELRGDSDARYAITKGVVDARCFRPMRLIVRFDKSRRELERTVEGGTIVDEAAWESARAGRNPRT